MKKEQQPRGMRNNNPLNIIHTKDKWMGLKDHQSKLNYYFFQNEHFCVICIEIAHKRVRIHVIIA